MGSNKCRLGSPVKNYTRQITEEEGTFPGRCNYTAPACYRDTTYGALTCNLCFDTAWLQTMT